jgi:Cytochrome C'
MTKYAIGVAVGVALTLALAAVGTARDKEDDKDTVEARKEVLDVVKAVEEGKDDKALASKAKAIKDKDVELNYLMKVYKLKEKGGVGFGDKPEPKSGIEAKIIELGRTERGPSVATLKKEGKEIIKLAQLNVAMAEIAKPHFGKPMDGKNKKDWDKWLDEQKAAAKELIEAVKKEDGKAVAKAAKEMLATCTECHSHFRK